MNLRDRSLIRGECQTQDGQHQSGLMRFETWWAIDIPVFAKAKMFGLHTDMYEIALVAFTTA